MKRNIILKLSIYSTIVIVGLIVGIIYAKDLNNASVDEYILSADDNSLFTTDCISSKYEDNSDTGDKLVSSNNLETEGKLEFDYNNDLDTNSNINENSIDNSNEKKIDINDNPLDRNSDEYTSSPVNINKADISELMTLKGIGEVKAQRIISYREEHGLFSCIEDIMNISGIKEASFVKIKDYITVGTD